MTIYARPGTTASIVPIKPRYENFIGGDWVKPLKGSYAEDLAPATGLAIACPSHNSRSSGGLPCMPWLVVFTSSATPSSAATMRR